ncbi:MAG: class I SAM-dependent methyltransferase [Gammaproteobacteria bacterium]|nr:class I SAM-dependent methyltransferase [Rhodocyclaceae bacterium]MBU3909812.1 class I SAM-dependent methyltransferase [Gammaproteobacteria bacterium]MBU3988086.1 class I SAM-dependent methyltransferase [Gammaproteobacteria bacterium]MBU4003609.1 class I SAM-dependent methyltransferase [Gammaproteobacteria bacterium]MBU4020032.1 class I SAM-dependent methyltransferase [Gammaproteobacteria bacterium]
MQSKSHWDRIYSTKPAESVGWFQAHPQQSADLIRGTGISLSAPIIDVGGGASRLVDGLLTNGYSNLTVLDLSAAALAATKARLGTAGQAVQWLEADITSATLPAHAYELWHDRAVFHFLTSAEDRQAYVDAVLRAVKPGGHVIVATFAEDGPSQCSGLPVVRYSAGQLHAAFGAPFTLLQHEREAHRTPSGALQHFVYCHFRKS